jgi:hypothetical protein
MGTSGTRRWDKKFLPYLTTHERIPAALPHLLAKDDVIRGYFIPAGSVIMCNVWYDHSFCFIENMSSSKGRGVLHDESRYPKPFDFTPERHLDGSCPDPMVEVFGFGKRCNVSLFSPLLSYLMHNLMTACALDATLPKLFCG